MPARHRTLRRNQKKGRKNMGKTQHHTKTEIVVTVVRLIPVAIGTARVVRMIEPRNLR